MIHRLQRFISTYRLSPLRRATDSFAIRARPVIGRLLLCCSLLLIGCGGSTDVFPCVYVSPNDATSMQNTSPKRKDTFTQGQPAMVCIVNPPSSNDAMLKVDIKPVDDPSNVHMIEIDSAISTGGSVSSVRYELPTSTAGEFLIELRFDDRLIAESKYVVKAD